MSQRGNSRNTRGGRRVSAPVYKFLLTAHIGVSVGWLGIVVAKLVLGLAAVTSDATDTSDALFLAMDVLNVAFPPVAIGTIVTGVLLSLGTKWGLLQRYWVATKLVLTVGVIGTAVQLGDRVSLVVSLAVVHVLMLAVATVISVYKPWGTTWWGLIQGQRRSTISPSSTATW